MRRRVAIILGVVVLLAVFAAAGVAVVLLGRSAPTSDGTEAPVEEQRVANDEPAPEPPAEEDVEEDPGTPVTMAEAPVFTTTRESGLTVTAPDAFLQTEELASVEAAVAELAADGNTVCVALVDLETRRGLWLNADELMYPASSIKAAYCLYVYEGNDGAGELAADVEDALVNSSNESYHSLFSTFGLSGFEEWLERVGGIELDPYREQQLYPDVSANALAAVWEELWRYQGSGTEASQELVGFLARTNYSPIAEELRETCEVWSKPGWYPLDEYGIPATNDTGIVLSPSGPYVMVVLTDVSADLESIKPLVRALDAAHAKMCGNDVAYYE